MSKIKNSWLDHYGAESFKQQKFGTAGTEGVNQSENCIVTKYLSSLLCRLQKAPSATK